MNDNYLEKLELTSAQQELIRAQQEAILNQMTNNIKEETVLPDMPLMGGYPSTRIVNKCDFDIHCTQSWGGFHIREGIIIADGEATCGHDVKWYDYTITSRLGSFTRYLIAAGGKIVVTKDCF